MKDNFKGIEKALLNKKTFFDKNEKYAVFSDFHLGAGDSNDNSLKNANFIFEALKYYLDNDYQVILNGDTFELVENKHIDDIKCAHENIMWVISELYKKNKLTIIRGNHDECLNQKLLLTRKSSYTKKEEVFLDSIDIYDSAEIKTEKPFLIMHGHQVIWYYHSFFGKICDFLIRYIWCPLEKYLLKDPTSEVDGFEDHSKVDKPFSMYGSEKGYTVVCGHTHSVQLLIPNYFNIGGGTMPRCITCGEIVDGEYIPYKWSYVVENQIVYLRKSKLD